MKKNKKKYDVSEKLILSTLLANGGLARAMKAGNGLFDLNEEVLEKEIKDICEGVKNNENI